MSAKNPVVFPFRKCLPDLYFCMYLNKRFMVFNWRSYNSDVTSGKNENKNIVKKITINKIIKNELKK